MSQCYHFWRKLNGRPGDNPALRRPFRRRWTAPYHSRQLNVSKETSVSPRAIFITIHHPPRLELCGWVTVAAKFSVKKFPSQRPLEGIYESGFPGSGVEARRSMFHSRCTPAGPCYYICRGYNSDGGLSWSSGSTYFSLLLFSYRKSFSQKKGGLDAFSVFLTNRADSQKSSQRKQRETPLDLLVCSSKQLYLTIHI